MGTTRTGSPVWVVSVLAVAWLEGIPAMTSIVVMGNAAKNAGWAL